MTSVKRAIEGFLLLKSAEGISHHTLRDYSVHLNRFAGRMDGKPIEEITKSEVNEFFHWVRHDFKITHRGNQPIEPRQLSSKTIRNCWAALSSFFQWVMVEYNLEENPFKVPCPRLEAKPIPPLSKDEVTGLLAFANIRDKALILVLLDTGARVSEICNANVEDVDLETGRLLIRKCKNNKIRVCFLGKTARKALSRYLFRREDKMLVVHYFMTVL